MFDRSTSRPSPALAQLCRFDVLSADEERRLFSRLRRLRAEASRLGAEHGVRPRPLADPLPLAPQGRVRRNLRRARALWRQAVAVRNRLTECNMRLIVSVAANFVGPERPLEDLVSEACLPLIRCIDRFDPARETRFSTYATRALTHYFSRLRRHDHRRLLARSDARVLDWAARDPGQSTAADRLVAAEEASRVDERLVLLPARERELIRARFGLTDDRRALTFREIGQKHGLSKERARVLTARALGRLRRSMNAGAPLAAAPDGAMAAFAGTVDGDFARPGGGRRPRGGSNA